MKCLVCGTETKGNIKYCSEEHHREYWRLKNKKVFKEKKCVVCDNLFIPISNRNKYCSKNCKYIFELQLKSKKTGVKTCKNCNKKFEPYTSLDKFCSANCRIENQKKSRSFNWNENSVNKITKENNPAFRNGFYMRGRKKISIGERKYLKNIKQIKTEIIEKHGYLFCQYCGSNNSLRWEGHHLIFRSERPLHEHLHDKENIILLCIKCHNEFHRNKETRNEIVKERKLNEIFNLQIT